MTLADAPALEGDHWMLLGHATRGAPEYPVPEEGDLEVGLVLLQGGRLCALTDGEGAEGFYGVSVWQEGWERPRHAYGWDASVDAERPCTEVLLPGLYRLFANPNGDFLSHWWPDATVRGEGADVQLAPGETIELAFPLAPAGKIEVADWRGCSIQEPDLALLCHDESCRSIAVEVAYANRPISFKAPVGSWEISIRQNESDGRAAAELALGALEVEHGEATQVVLGRCSAP